MNPSADEETLSAAEVSKTNQVTVATVTTTSTTNTQTVAGTGACYIPLLTGYAPQQALPNYSYQSSGYQQSVADYQEHPVAISVKMSRCQDDIFPRIELIPSFVLSSDNTNCKNDIQLFHQLFDELSVHTDYH